MAYAIGVDNLEEAHVTVVLVARPIKCFFLGPMPGSLAGRGVALCQGLGERIEPTIGKRVADPRHGENGFKATTTTKAGDSCLRASAAASRIHGSEGVDGEEKRLGLVGTLGVPAELLGPRLL